jgi:integrase/recombinase XerD
MVVSMSAKVDEYLREVYLSKRPNTFQSAQRILMEYLNYADPRDIRASVIAFLAGCRAKGNSIRTQNVKVERVLTFYRWLKVPLDLKAPKFSEDDPEIFSDEELVGIFRHAGKHELLFRTLLQTGLRVGELEHLRYQDVTDRGIIVRPHGDWMPKGKKARTIIVPQSLIKELRAIPKLAGSDNVFHVTRQRMARQLKKAAQKAGINPSDVWVHKLRGNFATTLLRRGVDVRTVMHQLGHTKLDITLKYLALLGNTELQTKIEQVWS